MPPGSKKRKAIKRKKEMTNHETPTNSSDPQGNGAGSDHDDSSDHVLTDEDLSPRAAMEAQPEPVPEPAASEQASIVPIEQQTVLESEQTEDSTTAASEILEESSAHVEVGENSGEGSLNSKGTEIAPRDTPAAGPALLLERRASWWNCCGLLDVFGGSQR